MIHFSQTTKFSFILANCSLALFVYFRAFVGPSIGGYLLDEFGFRNASMALIILEITLVSILCIKYFFQ